MKKAETFALENYADDVFDQQKLLTKVSNKLQNFSNNSADQSTLVDELILPFVFGL